MRNNADGVEVDLRMVKLEQTVIHHFVADLPKNGVDLN
jgi:glycerophosphoryl diester phosphodiesterase